MAVKKVSPPGGGPVETEPPSGGFKTVVSGGHPVSKAGAAPDTGRGTDTPSWWAIYGSSYGSGLALPWNGGIKGIAATDLLPVAYGTVLVPIGVVHQWDGSSGWSIDQHVMGVACSGGIDSILAVYCNGGLLTTRNFLPYCWCQWTITNYLGYAGDYEPSGWWWGGHTDYYDFSGWEPKPAYSYMRFQGYASGSTHRWWYHLGVAGSEDPLVFSAKVKGRRCYDPRTGLTVYTENPALIWRDLRVTFGKQPAGQIDDQSVSDAATICETLGFTCNISFTESTTLDAACREVLLTCAGREVPSRGKTGIFIDTENTGEPVTVLREADGGISKIKYEWLPASSRPTRLTVQFTNPASDWKPDSTPPVEDPGINDGSVPLVEKTVAVRGCTNLDSAIALRDYLFNSAAITLRLKGLVDFRGAILEVGQKVTIVTLSGVATDFMVDQRDEADTGLYPAVFRPYDESIYGSTPVTQGPPVVNPPVDPSANPGDITVVGQDAERKLVASTGDQETVYNIIALVDYTLPPGEVVTGLLVRAYQGDGAATKTWADMAASEIRMAITGNEPPATADASRLSHPGIPKGTETLTFDMYGRIAVREIDKGPMRMMVKVTSKGGISDGVTIDWDHETSTDNYPLPDIALWKWVKSSDQADGTRKTFSVPDKPVAGTLVVVADGQTLVDSTFSPAQGADYSYSGQVVTIASGRAAPLSYVALFYQVSHEA